MERCHLVPETAQFGPRYIIHFRVVARVGKVAYCLDLHVQLTQIHNTFLHFLDVEVFSS